MSKESIKKYLIPVKLTDLRKHNGNYEYSETLDRVFLESESDIDKARPLSSSTTYFPFQYYPTDYSLMNNAKTTIEKTGYKNCNGAYALLRSPNKFSVNGVDTIYYSQDIPMKCSTRPTDCQYSLFPSIRLNLTELEKDGLLEQLKKRISEGYFSSIVQYKTLTLGEYPQKYVGQELDEFLESEIQKKTGKLLKSTGRSFPGNYLTIIKLFNSAQTGSLNINPGQFVSNFNALYRNQEYTYNGKKYVRSHSGDYPHGIQLSDGSKLQKQKNWVEVTPIRWIIKNWDKLPQSINPFGTGEQKYLDLRCDDGIIAGLPFNPQAKDNNNELWQNSLIRAYLNGYDIHKEISNLNGNPQLTAQTNYALTELNFLTDALSNDPILSKSTTTPEIINNITTKRKKASKYATKVIDKNMSIDDQIRYYINNRRSFMLHGKSGIGKSRRIADIDPDYFLLTLRNGMMPEEIMGKECPNPNGEGTKWYPPSWYEDLCKKCEEEPDKNHILFIDELTNVNEYEQSLAFHLVLNRRIGVTAGKLPENCVVVAAGNSKEESNSAYNMSEPLFRRFHGHIYLPLDVESVLEWGSELRKNNPEQTNIHPLIASYLAAYPNCLYTEYDPEKPGKNYAVDPRAWEQVSDIIYDNNGELWQELIENKIGEANATSLLAFADKNFITLEDILEENYDEEDIPARLDEQYALALTLRYTKEKDIAKVREFISNNLSGETLAKFDFVWVNNNPERAMIIEELSSKQPSKNPFTSKETIEIKDDSKRIHIIDFFSGSPINNQDDRKEIVVNSKLKAEFLTTAFHLLGKTWCDGDSYRNNDQYNETFFNKYCYYDNCGQMSSTSQSSNVYDFFDVNFAGVLPKDIINRIEKMKESEYLERIH